MEIRFDRLELPPEPPERASVPTLPDEVRAEEPGLDLQTELRAQIASTTEPVDAVMEEAGDEPADEPEAVSAAEPTPMMTPAQPADSLAEQEVSVAPEEPTPIEESPSSVATSAEVHASAPVAEPQPELPKETLAVQAEDTPEPAPLIEPEEVQQPPMPETVEPEQVTLGEELPETPITATGGDGNDDGGDEQLPTGGDEGGENDENGEESDDQPATNDDFEKKELWKPKETAPDVVVEHRRMDETTITTALHTGTPEHSPRIAEAVKHCDVVAFSGFRFESKEQREEQEQSYTEALAASRPDPGQESDDTPTASTDINDTLSYLKDSDKRVVLLGVSKDDPEFEKVTAFQEAFDRQERLFEDVAPLGEIQLAAWESVGAAANMEDATDRVVRRQVNELMEDVASHDPYAEVGLVMHRSQREIVEKLGDRQGRQGGNDPIAILRGDDEGKPFYPRAVAAMRNQYGEEAGKCVNKYILSRLIVEYVEGFDDQRETEVYVERFDDDQVEDVVSILDTHGYRLLHAPIEERRENIRDVLTWALNVRLDDQ